MTLRESISADKKGDSGIESLGPEPEKEKGTTEKASGVETRGLREQIDIFKPLFRALISSRIGLAIGIISILFFLFIFLSISYLGGISAGIVAVIIVLLILIYIFSPYVKIETINPASKGIPQFLGKRIETYILNEGAVAVVRNVPIIGDVFGYIPIHVGTVDIDLPGIRVRGKDNFELTLHGTMSINADPNRLIEFYNRGGAHGIDKGTGETIKEYEGDKGIVDLLKNIAIVSIQSTARDLDWEEIYNVDESLRNDALTTITGTDDPDADALLLDKTYDIPGIGTQLTNLTVGSPDPQGTLKEVIDMQPREVSEREYRKTEAETARILYQAVMGITDEELKKVDDSIIENFYFKLKVLEQKEGAEGNVELGGDIFKISAAKFLDNINLENIGDILNLLSKLKGGKKE